MVNYIIIGVIVLHLLAGFGWILYKLEFQKNKPKEKDPTDFDDSKKQ